MKNYCILGNCQANAISATLQVCAEFKENFSFTRTTPIHRTSVEEHRVFLTETLPKTDLFIYQPISTKYRGGGFGFDSALPHLSGNANVVSFPSIQFYGYHATAKPLSDIAPDIRQHSRLIFGLPTSELFHFSQLIVCFLRDIPQAEALYFFHEGFDGDAEFVSRRCSSSLAALRLSEEKHFIDARIHDMVESTFRSEQLFWSPRHPSGKLLGFVAEAILRKIGITPTDDERARFISRDPLRLPQYPLQELVRNSLGIDFSPANQFSSKSKNLGLADLVGAYYELYQKIGKTELLRLAVVAYPNLKSLLSTLSSRQY